MPAPPTFVPAILSADGLYRYELRREVSTGSWDIGTLALFCGANPSTADDTKDDHTIRKELGFTGRWGCGGFIKINLFGFRARHPTDVPRGYDAFGPKNHEHIEAAFAEPRVKIVVAAWGDCLAWHPLAAEAIGRFRQMAAGHDVLCFGRTKRGQPRHPLTLPYSLKLETYA